MYPSKVRDAQARDTMSFYRPDELTMPAVKVKPSSIRLSSDYK